MKKIPQITLIYRKLNPFTVQTSTKIYSKYHSLRSTNLKILLTIYFGLHALVALTTCRFNLQELQQRLTYLDSNWYLQIARFGYRVPPTASFEAASSISQYAFLPLWPLSLKAVSFLPIKESLPLTGALISFGLTAVVIVTAFKHGKLTQKDHPKNILYPANFISLLYILFNPGSWVFLSNHTESLFLFLSFFAFHFINQRNVTFASLFSGLATLTRNQGILVAITVGLIALQDDGVPLRKRATRFLLIGISSFGFYSCWLLFLYLQTGDIFISSRAQQNWRITTNWQDYLSNATWLSPNNAPRAALFWTIVIIGISISLRGKKKYRDAMPMGFYFISSALLWPLQGNNFPQAYRFASVLFPFWNVIGTKTEHFLRKVDNPLRLSLVMILFSGFCVIAGIISNFYYSQAPNTWPY
jgi:Gpi18-like mannosyltransferase